MFAIKGGDYLTQDILCVYLSKSAFKAYIHIDFGPVLRLEKSDFQSIFLRKDNQWLIPFPPGYYNLDF